MMTPHKGFTLLISVVLASVALSIGLALLDISYRQVVLASSAKQSQYAFYAADATMECALYFDQQMNTFSYAGTGGSVTCNGNNTPITVNFNSNQTVTIGAVTYRTRTFTIPCAAGGTTVQGAVTIYKASDATTQIFATGYNTCDPTNTRRIERGLKASY